MLSKEEQRRILFLLVFGLVVPMVVSAGLALAVI